MKLAIAIAAGLLGCGFHGEGDTFSIDAAIDAPPADAPDAAEIDSNIDAPPDGPCTMTWPFEPTNWTACQLPAPRHVDFSALDNDTFDVNTQSGTDVPQDMAPHFLLVHLDVMDVPSGQSITIIGNRPVIFAVDGDVTINGSIGVLAGRTTSCDADDGGDSLGVGGGGGGGGAGGLHDGGAGTAGSGLLAGSKGAKGPKIGMGDMISPLIGGCRGGDGGIAGISVIGVGGTGGGALQITSKTLIAANGIVQAVGTGGGGGGGNAGAGGGGAGGAIFFEAPTVTIGSGALICTDGGSGGQGGGGGTGSDGMPGKCDGATGASTVNIVGSGGEGGDGGYVMAPTNAGNSSGAGGGGGGGGAAGFIRFRGIGMGNMPMIAPTAVVTPMSHNM